MTCGCSPTTGKRTGSSTEIRRAVAACPEQDVGGTIWRHRLRALRGERPGDADGRPDLRDRRRRTRRAPTGGRSPGSGTPYCSPGPAASGCPAARSTARSGSTLAASAPSSARCASSLPTGARAASPTTSPSPPATRTTTRPSRDPATAGTAPAAPSRPRPFAACGRRPPHAAHDDRLLARWTNVEDFRARQLTTFPDADLAAASVAALTDLYRRCPVEDESDDYAQLTDVRRTAYGDESWAVVRRRGAGRLSRRGPHGPAHRPRRTSGPRRHRLQRGRRRPRPGGRHPPPARRAGPSLRRPSSPPCASSPKPGATESLPCARCGVSRQALARLPQPTVVRRLRRLRSNRLVTPERARLQGVGGEAFDHRLEVVS